MLPDSLIWSKGGVGVAGEGRGEGFIGGAGGKERPRESYGERSRHACALLSDWSESLFAHLRRRLAAFGVAEFKRDPFCAFLRLHILPTIHWNGSGICSLALRPCMAARQQKADEEPCSPGSCAHQSKLTPRGMLLRHRLNGYNYFRSAAYALRVSRSKWVTYTASRQQLNCFTRGAINPSEFKVVRQMLT